MLKVISILFIAVQLISSTELCQLFKLPVLVSHYQAHRAADHQLGLISFLNEHYLQSDPSDADYQSDMQLPFKTNSNSILANSYFSIAIISHFHFPAILPVLPVKKFGKAYPTWIPSDHSRIILQPPRLA